MRKNLNARIILTRIVDVLKIVFCNDGFKGVRTGSVHDIAERHKLKGVNIKSPKASTNRRCPHVHIGDDIVDNLNGIFVLIQLHHIKLLKLISLLADNKSLVLLIHELDYLTRVLALS